MFGLFASNEDAPDWFLRIYAILTTLAAGFAGAYMWWTSKRKEHRTEAEQEEDARKEKEKKEIREFAKPFKEIAEELRQDNKDTKEGLQRAKQELVDALVKVAVVEGRFAFVEKEHRECQEEQNRLREENAQQHAQIESLTARIADLERRAHGG